MLDSPIVIDGGGSIGKRHIRNLQSLGYHNIFCLKRKQSSKFEKEFNVKVVTSYECLKDIKPLAVFVCNPTSLHIKSLEHAVIVDSHIFMEKPLVHNEFGLTHARSVLKKNSKVFFIGFMLRFHPLVKEIKSIIDSTILGKVYSARFEFGSYLPYWHPWEDYKTSYASRRELGGGVINTITHELDLIQYFFGNPNSVTSQKANFNKLDIEVEELFEGILIYDDKLVTLHLDYLQKDYDRRISILCDEGSINWNWHDNEIVVKNHKSEAIKIPLLNFDVNQLYLDELEVFFELINKGKIKHSLDQDHAINNTKITLALHKAADLNQKVRING